MDLVKRVSGEVRDNVRMLDRTRVCMIFTACFLYDCSTHTIIL